MVYNKELCTIDKNCFTVVWDSHQCNNQTIIHLKSRLWLRDIRIVQYPKLFTIFLDLKFDCITDMI